MSAHADNMMSASVWHCIRKTPPMRHQHLAETRPIAAQLCKRATTLSVVQCLRKIHEHMSSFMVIQQHNTLCLSTLQNWHFPP